MSDPAGPQALESRLSAQVPPHMDRSLDAKALAQYVAGKWDDDIVPRLVEYIAIPNKSPMFDADWVKHGYMDQAVALMEGWAKKQAIPGMVVETVRLPNRTPLIFLEIPAANG